MRLLDPWDEAETIGEYRGFTLGQTAGLLGLAAWWITVAVLGIDGAPRLAGLILLAPVVAWFVLRGLVRLSDRRVRWHYAQAMRRYDDRLDVWPTDCDDHPACRGVRGYRQDNR